ncbi:MAG: helix-turn-helix domain-containing protein [Novosphingobium sp.]
MVDLEPGIAHILFMEELIERQLDLRRVSVVLGTLRWGSVEDVRPRFEGYNVCQRLSGDHAPIRIGNLGAREAFRRVRSIGFLPPDCGVRLHPVDGPFRVINCVFDRDWFETTTGIDDGFWEEHTRDLVSIRNRRLEILMQDIQAEMEQPGFGHELLIESASTMMLVELARYLRQPTEPRGAAGHGLAPWQMRRIEERIEAADQSGYPSLAELATLAGISQSHLMRGFKASTGWPIHKFIAEERLRAAKQLLASEDLNSREIAGRLGFSNPAYFATAFRRMTGKTPSEYRREARAGVYGRN